MNRQLSREQRAAAAAAAGPVRVLAGAGTGKTAVIVERFCRLVSEGVPPAGILVMTFTERAAGEMRQRIESRLGSEGELSIGTFHAITQRWLRQDGAAAGLPGGFRILGGAERWILAWKLLWELGEPALCDVEHPEHQLGGLLKMLERLKQELIPVGRLESWTRRAERGEQRDLLTAAVRLFRAYSKTCRRERLLDFDDLILGAVRMLTDSSEILARYRSRYPHVLVDEYQDTNLAQERVVELIAGESRSAFVVGDDDQSIYRFRGASRASLERFAEIFPELETMTLTRNRRSTQLIVAASTALVQQNAGRLPKTLSASRRTGPAVEIWHCPDGGTEVSSIAAAIRRLAAEGVALPSIAVLTRTNAIAAPIARSLRAAGVPCRTSDWWGFLERPASKDLIAALRLLSLERDEVAQERLRAGFGGLTPAQWEDLRRDLQADAARLGISDLFFELMERSGYLETQPRGGADAIRFGELVSAFTEHASDQSLTAFLEHLELVQLSGLEVDITSPDAEADADAQAVNVMTIHQAKGLEFEAVFVPAMVDGRLPQPPRRERLDLPPEILQPAVRGREDHLAEERRLCYVAMTRARTWLHLTWADRYEGDRRWKPSSFLEQIRTGAPASVVERELPGAPASPGVPPPQPAREAPDRPVHSFSSLSAYRDCPRLHWYRYQRRLPPAPTVEGRLGDVVHRSLMWAGERRAAGDVIDVAALEQFLDRAWAERPFPKPEQERVFKRLARDMICGYLADGGLDQAPSHLEHSFEFPLDGFALRGVIDRIDPPAEAGGPHVLIDYKTGAALPASRLRRDFQLALYALAARRHLGLGPLELEIVYLRERKRIRMMATDDLLEQAERTAVETAAAISEGSFEPRPERHRCRSCAYRLACDASM